MSERILYTSVFGGYDKVVKQSCDGWDWKCFSEENSLPIYEDNMRNAKRYKILPHRFLSEYEISIYISDLNKEIDFSEYQKNFISFKNHFKKCIQSTYQTFGVEIKNNIIDDIYIR